MQRIGICCQDNAINLSACYNTHVPVMYLYKHQSNNPEC